jgi:hypothetical protein
MLYLSPDECEPECPEHAIFQSDAVSLESAQCIGPNRRWFDDRQGLRARIDTIKPGVAT